MATARQVKYSKMDTNNIINDVLADLYADPNRRIFSFMKHCMRKYNDNMGQNATMYDIALDKMIANDIVKRVNDSIIQITNNGIKIQENGGYLKYIESSAKEKEEEERLKQIQRQKLIDDAKTSSFQSKTRKAPIIISSISTIIAVISIIISSNYKSEVKELRNELQNIKDTISVLSHPKTEAPLHIAKNDTVPSTKK